MRTSFLFLGAGKARYFEEFNLTVKFRQTVGKKEQQKILAVTPRAFKKCESIFDGSLLVVHLEKYIQLEIQQSYGQKHQRCPAHEYIEHWCAPSAGLAFEKDFMRWLMAAHKISPILFVVRPEDPDAEGISFSSLHKASIPEVKTIIESWIAQPDLVVDRASFAFRIMMSHISAYVKFRPKILIEVYKRYALDRLVEYYFHQNEKKQIIRLLKHSSHSDGDFELLALGFNRYKTSNKRNLALIAETLPYFAKDTRFGKMVLSLSMEYNQYIIEALCRTKNFSLIEKIKKMIMGLSGKYQDSAVHHFYNDAEGDYKLKRNWPVAICLYDIAITILSKNGKTYWDETFYCNALWILQRDNTGLPVNEKLNKKFLKVCLPQVKENPAIAYNAACLYAEMNKPRHAFAAVKKGIQTGLDEDDLKVIVPEIQKHTMFKAVREQTDILEYLKGIA